jgi:hypothetical protein
MRRRVHVLNRYPEAQAVEEWLGSSANAWSDSGRWFIYAGAELDARVLGRGDTESQAWEDAARRMARAYRRVKWLVAG